ncbi:MAG: hypothetical protein FJ015_07045 [Chloroflexi bacterium]|nr:hypothetical protein [Chloroflexota bacterium]
MSSMKTGFYLYTTVDGFRQWLKFTTTFISGRRFPSGEGYFCLEPARRGRWTVDGSTILEMKGTYIAPRGPDEPNVLEACPVGGQISFQVIALPLSEGIKVTAECANTEVFGDFFQAILDLIAKDFSPEENPQVREMLDRIGGKYFGPQQIQQIREKLDRTSPNYVVPQVETPPQAAPSPEQSQVSDKPPPYRANDPTWWNDLWTWYEARTQQTGRLTLRSLAGKVNVSYSYMKEQHARWKAEHANNLPKSTN